MVHSATLSDFAYHACKKNFWKANIFIERSFTTTAGFRVDCKFSIKMFKSQRKKRNGPVVKCPPPNWTDGCLATEGIAVALLGQERSP